MGEEEKPIFPYGALNIQNRGSDEETGMVFFLSRT